MSRNNCENCVHKVVCALWEIQNELCDSECTYYQPTLTPQNEPLMMEQLQKMDEPTPVWWEKASCWCLCERGFIIVPNGNIYEFKETDGTFYRRPPEGDEST